MEMSLQETVARKLQQATCDKPELNRQVLRIQRSLREAQKALDGNEKRTKKN